MRKLLCLLLSLLFLPVLPVTAEEAALTIETPAEAIRPAKATLLKFTVPEDGVCDLTLQNVEGAHVMDVVTDIAVSAGENQLWWNGTSGGIAPAEGVYQLVLTMGAMETACTVVIGAFAPYLTAITPAKDAQTQTMTVDFYASVDGLLTVGLWSGDSWTLLENRQVQAGMNSVVWDASDMNADTSSLTLTLTDSTGFSSNEEHITVAPEDFGISFATPTPAATATPTATPTDAPEEESADTPVTEATAAPEQPTDAPEEESADAPVTETTDAPEQPTDAPEEESADAPVTEDADAPEQPTDAPEAVESVLTPVEAPTDAPEDSTDEAKDDAEASENETDTELTGELDTKIELDLTEAEAVSTELDAGLTAEDAEEIVYTPSYGSPYPLTEADEGTYWGTPMDITDTEAIWTMLTSPITVVDASYKGQKKIYAEPSEDSRVVAVVTGSSQGVRVIETLDNGWTLIELYSSTFHDNSIEAWNMLVQGYIKTSMLKTQEVDKKYHIIVDKLTQRLYLFGEGELLATLLVSTGVANAEQPYNETRSGDYLYISPTGGFSSDNMFCPMGMKFNDGDLLHEVPYIQRSEGGSKIYSTTEPYLGQRASHGCIRVQRKENADGYNMEWIWDHRKDVGRIVIWEDWQGRQIEYPSDDTVLYYNPNGGSYYHSAEKCESAKDSITFTAFTYAELDTGVYADLEYCPYCVPAQRKSEIDAVNEAHALGGDHDPILTEARQKYLDKVVDQYGLDALTEGELRYYQTSAAE